MHTGRVDVPDVITATRLYEVSKYFGVEQLTQACQEFLEGVAVKDETAAQLYNFAERNEFTALQLKVSSHIKENADKALEDAKRAAALLGLPFLRELFESGEIQVSETTLFRILVELEKESQAELLPFLRLPLIPVKLIMESVVPSGLFDNDCMRAIAFQSDPKSVVLPEAFTQPRGKERSVQVARQQKPGESNKANLGYGKGKGKQPAACFPSPRPPEGGPALVLAARGKGK